MALSINITNLLDLDKWFENMVILLSKYVNKLNEESLQALCNEKKVESEFEKFDNNILKTDDFSESLYRSSPFYKRYENIHNEIISRIENSSSTNIENVYSNKEFLGLILKKYMPFSPFWTCILTRKRLSNAIIENYFGYLKNGILEGSKNMKCSRFIRAYQNDIHALCNEVKINIEKSNLNIKEKEDRETDEKQTQESWSRKPQRHTSHFSGSYLKKLVIVKETRGVEDKIGLKDDDVITIGKTNSENLSENEPGTYLYIKCMAEIESISLSSEQREIIAKETIPQRNCELWWE